MTDAERARVAGGARAARMPIGPYLSRIAAGTPIVRRDDWRRGVAQLARAAALLEELADRARDAPDPLDALALAARLVALERTLDDLARPWAGIDANDGLMNGNDATRHGSGAAC